MSKIIKEIMNFVPEDKISDACFEGANIVLYTKNKAFALEPGSCIKDAVNAVKKRIELRPDPAITLNLEKAEKEMRTLIPEEAGLHQIIFDPQRSRVIIEAEKPGLAIGKQGSILREIKANTLWVPVVRRSPPIKCQLIENIRLVLYQNSDYRRKFLDKTGHRIYDGWSKEKKQQWVRLSFLGAGRQVGRSCFLLQTPESKIVLDCGVDPAGIVGAEYPFLEAPEFNINDIDGVIITHAHLDHHGFLPYLFKYGYRGPVYCTAPTRDIMALLQLDMIKIARSEGKEPLYTSDDVKEALKHTICLGYEEVSDITPDIRITLYNAGHILGSAMVHIHIGNGLHNFLYTGDMKFGKTTLLDPAVTKFPRLETVMIESTYGGKDNNYPSHRECENKFIDIITSTLNRGGRVLCPVLGVGRAQEVLLVLEQLVRTGRLKEIPVYIDGMVWDVTAIHSAYPEFLNSNVRRLIFQKDHNPFLSPMFKQVGSNKERQKIIEETGPCVVLATSGMLVGGPSVQYLKHFAASERNSLVFTSYQGEGSLGRRIQRGERDIIFDAGAGKKPEMVHINMETHTIDGLSGHSSRRELMSFIYKCQPKPKKVIINHGESSRCLDLASSLHKVNRIETICPRNLEVIRLR
ncbi:beta-CASP ribonuclease aCPSF1 [Candidatus Woesearchaeota archaeon CG10_big_fil_rev_8_21_14_0_10_34_8]|nr:MAG: beta-CASP ribonuclease aCPSF1 [Candidatus Woesearchaeota archaeon CG10_big_fil_rev_8_21_14_0_10_34_8]